MTVCPETEKTKYIVTDVLPVIKDREIQWYHLLVARRMMSFAEAEPALKDLGLTENIIQRANADGNNTSEPRGFLGYTTHAEAMAILKHNNSFMLSVCEFARFYSLLKMNNRTYEILDKDKNLMLKQAIGVSDESKKFVSRKILDFMLDDMGKGEETCNGTHEFLSDRILKSFFIKYIRRTDLYGNLGDGVREVNTPVNGYLMPGIMKEVTKLDVFKLPQADWMLDILFGEGKEVAVARRRTIFDGSYIEYFSKDGYNATTGFREAKLVKLELSERF